MYAVFANFDNTQLASHASNANATKLASTDDVLQAVAIYKMEQQNNACVAIVDEDTGEALTT
jgi:hypothetical protein